MKTLVARPLLLAAVLFPASARPQVPAAPAPAAEPVLSMAAAGTDSAVPVFSIPVAQIVTSILIERGTM